MTIDAHGNLLIQEDPGDNAQLARIVAYRIADGALGVLAQFDPSLFRSEAPGFITADEESSGAIDAEKLIGPGWFLFDAQAHAPSGDPASVELGQLLAMRVADFDDLYSIVTGSRAPASPDLGGPSGDVGERRTRIALRAALERGNRLLGPLAAGGEQLSRQLVAEREVAVAVLDLRRGLLDLG